MKIMMSSCLFGEDVMYWGGNFRNDFLNEIISNPSIEVIHFCPEHAVLGTPRSNMLIHGGDGNDIWTGQAQLLSTEGVDCSDMVKEGALRMLEMANQAKPDLIILTEGSDSCGSQVILDPETEQNGKYQFKKGLGIATALLVKNGFKVVGHKNEKEIYEILKSNIPNITDRFDLENFKMPSFLN
jgi:uncharacterized protein YbbK (DUF523 family)